MTPTVPFNHPQPDREVPALVRAAFPQDVMWDRPVFKAPPLRVKPPAPTTRDFAPGLFPSREPGLASR